MCTNILASKQRKRGERYYSIATNKSLAHDFNLFMTSWMPWRSQFCCILSD